MIWQDVLIMVGCFGFGFALLPSVFGRSKPARATCLLTSVILASFIVAYATLGLALAAYANAFVTICWLTLLLQTQRRYRKEMLRCEQH